VFTLSGEQAKKMMVPTSDDWESGRTASDPQKLFVLWLVKASLCRRYSDFQAHFGTEFDILRLARELARAGCLRKSPEGEYELTKLGDKILSEFENPPTGSSWGRMTALGPFAIRLFTRFSSEDGRGCFDALVGPDGSLVALAGHVSGPDDKALRLAAGLRILFRAVVARQGAAPSPSKIRDGIKQELQEILDQDSWTVRCVVARFTGHSKRLSIAPTVAVAATCPSDGADRTLAFACTVFPPVDAGTTFLDHAPCELPYSSDLVLTAPPVRDDARSESATLGDRLIRKLPAFGKSRPLFDHATKEYERYRDHMKPHEQDCLIASVRLATAGDQLILSALNNDGDPLDRFHKLFWKLYGEILKRISPGKGVDENDVFQGWWLHVVERLPQWHGESLPAWIKVVTVNYLWTLKRDWAKTEEGTSIKPQPLDDHDAEDSPVYEPSAVAVLKEATEQDLPRAIAGLSEEDRKLIQLKYFRELPDRQIADLLGKTIDQVKKGLQRVRDKLRRGLQPAERSY
jgi:RNA polymerase sigma factor (sigma-70 family)